MAPRDTAGRGAVSVLLAALLGTLAQPVAAQPFTQIVEITSGLASPIGIIHAGDGRNRLFVVEQRGVIRVWDGILRATPFLDLTALTCTGMCGEERGLLGLAFHPNYETNGFFYVFYTSAADGALVIARYSVSADINVANPGSALVLLRIPHPVANHNGGHLVFGPDLYLYAGTGDGGGGGDPDENGQDIDTLLGKILRIDVNGDGFPADPSRNYAIPPTNPYAGATAGADEVWHHGLRNPWHFSFDRATGEMLIGDVGQNLWEEIDLAPAGTAGINFGWDCREGAHPYSDNNGDENDDCPAGNAGLTDPILEYPHNDVNTGAFIGCSVTGGSVLRNLPRHAFHGNYFYGDFCTGRIWRGVRGGGGAWTALQLFDTSFSVSGFGEGESGRLYFTHRGGSLQWLAPYTFADVTATFWAWPHIEAIYTAGITTGCGPGPSFCVGSTTTRAEMAVFLVRGIHGPAFVPPPATGVFADVPAGYWAASHVEQLFDDGVTTGCATNPLRFCPSDPVTRAEMAIFLLRSRHGAGYTPPPATGTVFTDVAASSFAAAWIEQLAAEGITTGCAPGRYCPGGLTTRAEMAAFLARTFALALP